MEKKRDNLSGDGPADPLATLVGWNGIKHTEDRDQTSTSMIQPDFSEGFSLNQLWDKASSNQEPVVQHEETISVLSSQLLGSDRGGGDHSVTQNHVYEGDCTSTFHSTFSPVTAESQPERLSNIGLKDNIHLQQPSSTQNQGSVLVQNPPLHLYPCNYCSRCFAQKDQLHTHKQIHTREKPFQCFRCGKHFSHISNLNRHQSIHTGEKFQCSKCGKNFSFRTNLIRHQAIHTAR